MQVTRGSFGIASESSAMLGQSENTSSERKAEEEFAEGG